MVSLSQRRKISPLEKQELYQSVVPIAEEFRNKFLDRDKPIEDTFETLERLGYFIVRFPAHDKLSGFHINKGGYDCIFINSAHSLGRQYFSSWHECYHAYTKEGGGVSLVGAEKHSAIEQKADYFASCILMPENLITEYLQKAGILNLKFISHEQLITMQNYFRVSYAALLTRLIQLYPSYKETIDNRRILGLPQNKEKMLQKIEEFNGDLTLAQPTNEFAVSERFYQKLHDNLLHDKITSDKAEAILNLLESVKKRYEH